MPFAVAAQRQPAPALQDYRLAYIDDPLRVEFGAAEVSSERLNEAVRRAASARDWQVAEGPQGLELTRTVRSQHQMTVALTADAAGYTVRYLRSVNLLYRERDDTGRPLRAIHRNYNVWVRELVSTINNSLGINASVFVRTSSGEGSGKAASTSAAPMPDKLSIVAPADDTPAAAKAFFGTWQGKWGGDLDHMLIVEQIEGRTVHYVYSYGTSSRVPQAGFRRGSGTVDEGGVLRIVTNNGTLISYEPSKDGQSLQGQFQQGARVSSGVFTKRPTSN